MERRRRSALTVPATTRCRRRTEPTSRIAISAGRQGRLLIRNAIANDGNNGHFANVTDPVGQGFVASLGHPGGNVTGFSNYDPVMVSKWLVMLTQLTPPVANVAALYNPATTPYAPLLLHAIEEAAPRTATVKDDGNGILPAETKSAGKAPKIRMPSAETTHTRGSPLIRGNSQ
jgi:ABC transporter substrate binding protein